MRPFGDTEVRLLRGGETVAWSLSHWTDVVSDDGHQMISTTQKRKRDWVKDFGAFCPLSSISKQEVFIPKRMPFLN